MGLLLPLESSETVAVQCRVSRLPLQALRVQLEETTSLLQRCAHLRESLRPLVSHHAAGALPAPITTVWVHVLTGRLEEADALCSVPSSSLRLEDEALA